MDFHIDAEERVCQAFFCMALPGTVFRTFLGSVSPVYDGVYRRAIPPDLPADTGGISAKRPCDIPLAFSALEADGYFLPLLLGEMGIAFFLVCVRLDHNGITPVDDVRDNHHHKGFAVFL
jgi:hypothetical protein